MSTRIEAYSCKAVARERKLFKALETELMLDLSHSTSVSPPEQHQILLDSAFGPLDKPASRKTLWMLIGLLNLAFPDHDFSGVHPEEFRREESARGVLSSLSSALDHHASPSGQRSVSAYQPASSSPPFSDSPFTPPHHRPPSDFNTTFDAAIVTHPFLRQVLDPIIDLADCEVFSYTPDMDSDPHAAESDDEFDDDEESDAYERDDEGTNGMVWEMEGLEGGRGGVASTSSTGQPRRRTTLSNSSSASTSHQLNSNRSRFIRSTSTPGFLSYSGPPTPMKSFSSFLPPTSTTAIPGTPTSLADSEDYFREASSGGLLWSSNYFLFNKKRKRILFISLWAKKPEAGMMNMSNGGIGNHGTANRGGRGSGGGTTTEELRRAAISMRNAKRKVLSERLQPRSIGTGVGGGGDSFKLDMTTLLVPLGASTAAASASGSGGVIRVSKKRGPAIGMRRRARSRSKSKS